MTANKHTPDWNVLGPELLEAANLVRAALVKHGEWDDGCFYFGGKSASELQSPLAALTAAIAKAGGAA